MLSRFCRLLESSHACRPHAARVHQRVSAPVADCHTTHPARCCVCLPPVSLLQVLTAQRTRGSDLSVLQAFSYSSLQEELQVGWH